MDEQMLKDKLPRTKDQMMYCGLKPIIIANNLRSPAMLAAKLVAIVIEFGFSSHNR